MFFQTLMLGFKQITDYLQKHIIIIRVCLILPIILSSIYLVFFWHDTYTNYVALAYNDKIAQYSPYVKEIDNVTKVNNDISIAYTEPLFTTNIQPIVNKLFTVEIDKLFGIYYTAFDGTGEPIYRDRCYLISDYDKTEEDGLTVTLWNGVVVETKYNYPIVTVETNNQGTYTIKSSEDDLFEPVVMEALDGISYDEDHYVMSDNYIRVIHLETDTCPCLNLPNDNVYLDIVQNKLLQNVSSNYVYTFLLNSKIHLVLLLLVMLLFIVYKCRNSEKITKAITPKVYNWIIMVNLFFLITSGSIAYLLLLKN